MGRLYPNPNPNPNQEGRYSFPTDVAASDAARALVSGLMQVKSEPQP